MLGFATIGFALLYLGFSYNAVFTLGTNVSTHGESYARALQQLTTGIYLSEICLIGLFAIGVGNTNQSIGPLVLMIVFLAGTIVWHVLLNRHLAKLRKTLPEAGTASQYQREVTDVEKSGDKSSNGSQQPDGFTALKAEQGGQKQGGLVARVKRYFSPMTAAADAVWAVAPHLGEPVRPYTQQEHDEAYLHPAIISEVPIIWIAKDKYGLSKQEMINTRKDVGEGLEITDENAWYNEKGKIEWNEDIKGAPIYEDEPAY